MTEQGHETLDKALAVTILAVTFLALFFLYGPLATQSGGAVSMYLPTLPTSPIMSSGGLIP